MKNAYEYLNAIYEGFKVGYNLWKTVNPRKTQEELYKALNPYYK